MTIGETSERRLNSGSYVWRKGDEEVKEAGAHSIHNEMFAAALWLLLLLKFFVLLLAYSLPPEITHKNPPADLPIQPLFINGGLANLTHLSLYNMNGQYFEQLGNVYLANGLSKLQKLIFKYSDIDKQSLKAWLKGVLSSSHKGAALRELVYDGCEIDHEDERSEISFAFVDALSAGAFLNLEMLCDGCDQWSDWFLWTNKVSVTAFLVAMARRAPCASTLRSVWLGEVSQRQLETLQDSLPQVTDCGLQMQQAGIEECQKKFSGKRRDK